jgi:Zn-dependent protease/CBS domain-containing protein
MQGSLFVGTIGGFRIGIHYTWLVAMALVTWSLAAGVFPSQYPGWGVGAYWLAGFLAALALFASVLVHELAHSFAARSRGIGVEDITLFIFGGVARIKAEASTPRDEFLIAVVGPLASLGLAALAWLANALVGEASGPLGAVLFYTASANAILAVFNLIPGFPLDGGRVLRAIIWGTTGSVERATRAASMVGHLVGFIFIGIGIFQALGGSIVSGLWTIFIGWFINSGAETSRRQTETQSVFRGVKVADLMAQDPATADPNLSISDFVHDYAIRRGLRALPVIVGDRVFGIVSVTDARKAPLAEWDSTPIALILTRDDLAVVRPTDDANAALAVMTARDVNQVLVMDGDRLVGVLTRTSLLQYLQLHARFGFDAQTRRGPGSRVRSA